MHTEHIFGGASSMLLQLQHFNLTRRVFTRLAKSFEESQLDVQPDMLNNTLRWHLGHCIVIPEYYLFHYPAETQHIPLDYFDLFAADTKPADWKTQPPKLTELITEIEAQTERINALDATFFNKPLKEKLPFGRFTTYGDLFVFMIHHEAEHIGQMKTMTHCVEEELV